MPIPSYSPAPTINTSFQCLPHLSLLQAPHQGKKSPHPFKKRATAMCGPREREQYHLCQILSNCHLVMVACPTGWDTGVFDVYRVKAGRYQCLNHGVPIFTHSAETHFLSKTWFPDHQGFIKDHSQRHHFANKGLYSQSYGFLSSHVWV